jgi:hypothetical protein
MSTIPDSRTCEINAENFYAVLKSGEAYNAALFLLRLKALPPEKATEILLTRTQPNNHNCLHLLLTHTTAALDITIQNEFAHSAKIAGKSWEFAQKGFGRFDPAVNTELNCDETRGAMTILRRHGGGTSAEPFSGVNIHLSVFLSIVDFIKTLPRAEEILSAREHFGDTALSWSVMTDKRAGVINALTENRTSAAIAADFTYADGRPNCDSRINARTLNAFLDLMGSRKQEIAAELFGIYGASEAKAEVVSALEKAAGKAAA